MRAGYAVAALAVFVIEVLIALFVRDAFVRPYLGDALAVVLVYLALRSVTGLGVGSVLAIALAVAFAIEAGQAVHLLDGLGLTRSRLARVVLGGVFDVRDLVCYGVGAFAALVVELARKRFARRPLAPDGPLRGRLPP